MNGKFHGLRAKKVGRAFKLMVCDYGGDLVLRLLGGLGFVLGVVQDFNYLLLFVYIIGMVL